jgi:hypothetical protein
MAPGIPYEPEDEPDGWQVLDPGGGVVASGGQSAAEASAGAGEEN